MAKVQLRGVDYPVGVVNTSVLIPLFDVMGLTQGSLAEIQSMDAGTYSEKVLKRLAEPSRHYQIAFSLSQVFPSIPEEILRYQVSYEGDRRYVDIALALNEEEITLLMMTAVQALSKTKKPKVASPKRLTPLQEAQALPDAQKKTPAAIKPEDVPPEVETPVDEVPLSSEDASAIAGLSDEALAYLAKKLG